MDALCVWTMLIIPGTARSDAGRRQYGASVEAGLGGAGQTIDGIYVRGMGKSPPSLTIHAATNVVSATREHGNAHP